MGKVLLQYSLFILNTNDCIKKRKISQATSIFISIVGSLYVTGGLAGFKLSSQVDVVDVCSGARSRGPSMRHPRRQHAAAASTTSLFVIGGDATDKSFEFFNPQTRQ